MNIYPQYFFGKNNEYEIVIANTIEKKLEAWHLVYTNYLKQGYTGPMDIEFWYGVHDAMADTMTFLVQKNGKGIATLSMVFDSEIGLPADNLFSKELNTMRKKGKHPFEIVSLASDCTGIKESTEVLMHMFVLAHITAQHKYNATDWIITVNPHHTDYYRKFMFFDQCGSVKTYEKVNGAEAVLLTKSNEALRRKFIEKHSLKSFCKFAGNPVEEHRIFRFIRRNAKPIKWEEAKNWFENKRRLLSGLPKSVFKKLAIMYSLKMSDRYLMSFRWGVK